MLNSIQEPGELLAHGAILAGALCHAYIPVADRPQMFQPVAVKKSEPRKQEFNLP